MTTVHPPSGPEGPVEEFRALRTEIDRRSNLQQALVALEVTTTAAVAAVALAHPRSHLVLLVLPVVSLVLGAHWYDEHIVIYQIGSYIARVLHFKIPGGLGWESYAPARVQLRYRIAGPLAAYLLFPMVGVGSLVAVAITGTHFGASPWVWVGWSVGAVAAAWQVFTAVRVGTRAETRRF